MSGESGNDWSRTVSAKHPAVGAARSLAEI